MLSSVYQILQERKVMQAMCHSEKDLKEEMNRGALKHEKNKNFGC